MFLVCCFIALNPCFISYINARAHVLSLNPTRGFHWSDAETRALLNIWGEHDVQTALDGNFRNSHVYRDVAGRLSDMGYDRTPDQCRVRVKSLKRQYFQAQKAAKKNSHYHKMFKFFEEMERILSNRPPTATFVERQNTLESCTCCRCWARCLLALPEPQLLSRLPYSLHVSHSLVPIYPLFVLHLAIIVIQHLRLSLPTAVSKLPQV
uniref:Myb/SANT-like DNA-binding domain-containing protein n=1 Tax=Astyanax mexicanus TaxID=7994 RepID=A0A3B1IZS5_ASTMX